MKSKENFEGEKNIYVLYHNNCSDGRAAAYAAYKKFGRDARYLGVNYNQPFPNIKFNKEKTEVYVLDFSYSRKVLDEVYQKAKTLVVIDHHKTAFSNLEGAPYLIYSSENSGCVLAWNYFNPKSPVPMIFLRIEDRDLWKFKLDDSKDIGAYLSSFNDCNFFTFWDQATSDLKKYRSIVGQGRIIQRIRRSEIDKALKAKYPIFTVEVKGRAYKYVLANITNRAIVSELGSELAKRNDVDFSMSYAVLNNGSVMFELRSVNPDVDVSSIASAFGGGGHKAAAGFTGKIEDVALIYSTSESLKE